MAKQKAVLYGITAILLAFTVFLCVNQSNGEILSFRIASGENSQSIRLWQQESGKYYAFLPSGTKMEQVQIVLHTGNAVAINHVKLENGMTCEPFSEAIPYALSYTAWGRPCHGEITFLRSANVATLYIDTQSGNMKFIHAAKGNKESGTAALYLPDGTMAYSGDLVSIQGRGNGSWSSAEKKPYSIKLAENANLLNMGSAQKWILLANALDGSSLRNKVLFDFADRVGLQHSPESQWVDLYLNGDYAGLYLLCERNEVHPERVQISEKGNFLVSMEYRPRLIQQKYPYVATAASQYLRVHYPENPSESQLQKLESEWQSVENAILAEDGIDPVTGKHWVDMIDLDSWVRKYLMEEVFGNYDACFISQFFYSDGNPGERKIYAGPVWDYDVTMGMDTEWRMQNPNILHGYRNEVREDFNAPWFYTLCQKELFYERMVQLYQEEFLPLLNDFLYVHMDNCSQQIGRAFQLNQVRWNLESTDIRDQTEGLKTFMRERTAFLSSIWIEELPYCVVKLDDGNGGYYEYFAVSPGECIRSLPAYESSRTRKFLGLYVVDTGEPFSADDIIVKDITVQARWQKTLLDQPSQVLRTLIVLIFGIMSLVILYVDWKKFRR